MPDDWHPVEFPAGFPTLEEEIAELGDLFRKGKMTEQEFRAEVARLRGREAAK